MLSAALVMAAGLALLGAGAEVLVRSAARLALRLGLAPMVVGLTIVAFGTSAPELAVSIRSTLGGVSALALGNAVGSNIANIGLVLGLMALIQPVTVERSLVRQQIPLMVACSVGLLPLLADGALGLIDGALLSAGLAAFLAHSYWRGDGAVPELAPPGFAEVASLGDPPASDAGTVTGGSRAMDADDVGETDANDRWETEAGDPQETIAHELRETHAGGSRNLDAGDPRERDAGSLADWILRLWNGIPMLALLVATGLLMLTLGSAVFVDSAVAIAQVMGVSEAVIGLTVVAVGTSVPELATCLVAAYRGAPDIAVGNIIGSNLFNILGILGITALVGTISAAQFSYLDFGVMVACSLVLLPMALSRLTLSRLEGGILLACYLAYIGHLILAS